MKTQDAVTGWSFQFNYQQDRPGEESPSDATVQVFRTVHMLKPEDHSATLCGNEDTLISRE
jgi:hypothetical protein